MFCVTCYCFCALYVLHLNVICITFGYHACALIMVVYTRTHEKRAKVQKFSHIRKQKQQNFFFSFFLPLPPRSFLALSARSLPLSFLANLTHYSLLNRSMLRHIPDTYPIHTRHIPDTYVYPMNTLWIFHEHPMNTPQVPLSEEKGKKNRLALCFFYPPPLSHPCISQKKIVPLHS